MASLPLGKETQVFTWQDYLSWPDDKRWELIAGRAYAMAPAPSTQHQKVVLRSSSRLERALAGKPCQPFVAPTDVKLTEKDVVQPDVLVVCDPAKVTPSHIAGAPELVIEVLSQGSVTYDLREKKALYERAGVREYVAVHPIDHYALRFVLSEDGGLYDRGTWFAADEDLILTSLGDMVLSLREIFDLPLPAAVAPEG